MKRILVPVLLVLLVLIASAGCTGSTASPQATAQATLPADIPQEFSILWEAYQNLREDSVIREQLDPKKLSQGAVRGMLLASGDPYASYLDPEQYLEEQEDIRGSFEGIGAEVAMREGQVVIVAPIPDTPAERAGIKAGDIILSVDGASVEGKTLMEVVRLIRGPRGTVVTIGVRRGTSAQELSFTVTRDVIRIRSVRYVLYADGTANLKITGFTDGTNRELGEAITQMKKDNLKGIVLDLRNNPGGLLDSVINVASRFLKDGLVLYELDAQGNRTDWKVRRLDRVPDVPVVVLVNRYSASASEVLAGALRAHGRATLVGEKTFGKGSVNTLRQLSDGSGVYFSTARWYTPSGELIEGKGLQPDMEVTQPESGSEDVQLDKALEVLKGKIGG